MLAITFYDFVLWIHIAAVIVAFGGVFTYPLWFSLLRGTRPQERAFFHRTQALIGQRIIGPATGIILLAGAYLASDADAWSEVWVIVPLVILLGLMVGGPLYFGRNEERLAEAAERGDETAYAALFRPFQTGVYAALLAVLVAVFFMATKLG